MSNWKRSERELARYFGTERTPLSGGNSKHTRSDSLHEKLYLENKTQMRSRIWTLYRDAKAKAKREGKIPVVGLQEHGSHGILLVIHSNDLLEVASERIKASTQQKGN